MWGSTQTDLPRYVNIHGLNKFKFVEQNNMVIESPDVIINESLAGKE